VATRRLGRLDGGGPVDVGGHEIRPAAALVAQMAGELRGGRRLAGTVQADQHDDDRRGTAEVERSRLLAEQALQLAMHELDEVLLGARAPEHLLTEPALLAPF